MVISAQISPDIWENEQKLPFFFFPFKATMEFRNNVFSSTEFIIRYEGKYGE